MQEPNWQNENYESSCKFNYSTPNFLSNQTESICEKPYEIEQTLEELKRHIKHLERLARTWITMNKTKR